MALALANSRAVTHLCRSTSVLAFRWYVRPPLLRTMLQASSVSMCAVAKLIVPRHVWAISACVLQQSARGEKWKKNKRQDRAEDIGLESHLLYSAINCHMAHKQEGKEGHNNATNVKYLL